MFTNRVTMQHKKERGERTKGRKKNKTCFTNIFVIFFFWSAKEFTMSLSGSVALTLDEN